MHPNRRTLSKCAFLLSVLFLCVHGCCVSIPRGPVYVGGNATEDSKVIEEIERNFAVTLPRGSDVLIHDSGKLPLDGFHQWFIYASSPVGLGAGYETPIEGDVVRYVHIFKSELDSYFTIEGVARRAFSSSMHTSEHVLKIKQLQMDNGGVYILFERYER